MSDDDKSLPIAEMLRDADRAWGELRDMMAPNTLIGDLACHVRALAAEVERLTAERDAVARERDVLIAACIAESWRFLPRDPDGIEHCWRWEIGARIGTARTRDEAVAAVRSAAGLDREANPR